MPILNADQAKTVIVLKRSMNPGFAGIENELFYDDEDDHAVRRRQDLAVEAGGRDEDGVRMLRTLAIGAALAALGCSKGDAPAAGHASADSAVTSAIAKAEQDRAAQTDEWNRAEIIKRLGEAGLVVEDSGRVAHHPGIGIDGALLTVSGSALEVYILSHGGGASEGLYRARHDVCPNHPAGAAPALHYLGESHCDPRHAARGAGGAGGERAHGASRRGALATSGASAGSLDASRHPL